MSRLKVDTQEKKFDADFEVEKSLEGAAYNLLNFAHRSAFCQITNVKLSILGETCITWAKKN